MAATAKRLTDDERDFAAENMPLAKWAAAKFVRNPTDDHIQVALMAVAESIKTYDPAIGKFSTHAREWVKGRLKQQRRDDMTIRSPRYVRKVHKFWSHVLATSDVLRIVGRGEGLPENEPAVFDDPDRELDVIPAVRSAVMRLDVRSRYVVLRRMAGETLKAIGEDMGLTRERIRQIERDAHRELRGLLADYA